MTPPRTSFRLRRFLVEVLRHTSLNLRAIRLYMEQRIEARACDRSAQLWDALRTEGLSNIKVKVGG